MVAEVCKPLCLFLSAGFHTASNLVNGFHCSDRLKEAQEAANAAAEDSIRGNYMNLMLAEW